MVTGRSPVVAVLALLAASMLAACSGSDHPARPSSAAPTPIGELDPSAVRLVRAEFCDRVPAAAVRRALDQAPGSSDRWGNGDPVPNGSGSGDVGHEIGCRWTGAEGVGAAAWVFARPVATAFATQVIAQAGQADPGRGCRTEAANEFGTPAMLQSCAQPGVDRMRRAGLFGDTWLTCELSLPTSTPEATRRARLDSWCATVVAALRTS
jgi:hypothetical protein